MWYFCKYKDILGKPKTGLHSYRVFNVAIVDVLFTVLLAKFVHYYILEPILPMIIMIILVGLMKLMLIIWCLSQAEVAVFKWV